MRFVLWAVAVVLLMTGCKKENIKCCDAPPARLSLSVVHEVDGQPLLFDSLMYHNEAGEAFSVENLKYYLSNFRFFYQDSQVYASDTVWYIDAALPPSAIVMENTPGTQVDSVACYIGIDPPRNIHGKLAPTMENTAMEWPEGMGGGYHFIKLEGHWASGLLTPGFAVHLGTNPYLVAAGCKASFAWPQSGTGQLHLSFNVAEWFKNPHTYSLATDGVYTMGRAALMQKMKENGRDVLTLKP